MLLFILPEDRHDAQRFLFLNQTRQVVAEELAEDFVDHRIIGLAPHRIAELPFDGGERAFHVAALVVVRHVLFLIELEIVEGFLERAANRARRVRLEGDEPLHAALGKLLKVLYGRIRLVCRYFAYLEMLARLLDQRDELRTVARVFVQDANGSDHVCFDAAGNMRLDPLAALRVMPYF